MIVEIAAMTCGVALAVIVVTCGLVALLVYGLRATDRAVGLDDDDPGGGGGGGGVRLPDLPSDPGGEPAWWPEFERELAEYVTRRGARHR